MSELKKLAKLVLNEWKHENIYYIYVMIFYKEKKIIYLSIKVNNKLYWKVY